MANKSKKKSSNKILWILLGALLVLMVLVIALKGDDDVIVYAEEATERTILSTISESGTVAPSIELKIQPDVSGEIVFVGFREGDKVKKGDLLVTIRPENYAAALEQAQASLNAARAQWHQSKEQMIQTNATVKLDSINWLRNKDLLASKAISRMDFENSELKLSASRVQRESTRQAERSAYFQMLSSEASMKQSRENLNRTNIYATMDGTVTKLTKEEGERAVGSVQTEGSELMKIADLSKMEVEVEINEKDIRVIRIGDSALVELGAFDETKFKGRVSEIAYSATGEMGQASADQITNFKVKVEILRSSYINDKELMKDLGPNDSPFRPGMTAQVEIFTERKDNVISVPIQAVTGKRNEDDEEDIAKEIVFVMMSDGTVMEKEVETGLTDDTYIEILSGIASGERIVTGPYLTLTKELENGKKVSEQKDPKDKKSEGDEEEEEE